MYQNFIAMNLRSASYVIGVMLFFFSTISNADYLYNYYTLAEIEDTLLDLEEQTASKTDKVFRLYTIGFSFEGRPIRAVKFSDNPELEEEDEPVLVIDGGIHPNELTGSETSLTYIQYLFDAYYDPAHPDHAEVVGYMQDLQIWIIPSMNPDGLYRALEGSDGHPGDINTTPVQTFGWRQNAQPFPCAELPGGIIDGINLARAFSVNYWYDFDCTSSENYNYPATFPFEAHESRLIKQFILNRATTFVFHQHTPLQITTTYAGGYTQYVTNEIQRIWHTDIPSPLLNTITPTVPAADLDPPADGGVTLNPNWGGQYQLWLWLPTTDPLAADFEGQRRIPVTLWEYPIFPFRWGTIEDGKIGQYAADDGAGPFAPSSGDVVDFSLDRGIEIMNYLARQTRYFYSPRNHADMSRKSGPAVEDIAVIGATIGADGAGSMGGFYFRESDARDMLNGGDNRVVWNVQNNGLLSRDINAEIEICNQSNDPTCAIPYTNTIQALGVAPLDIVTFEDEYYFAPFKKYKVHMRTGEDLYGNDEKIYVFTTGPMLQFTNVTTPSIDSGQEIQLDFAIHAAFNQENTPFFTSLNDLEVRIFDYDRPSVILQASTFGTGATDYQILPDDEKYTTTFTCSKSQSTYGVEVWKPAGNQLIGRFTVDTGENACAPRLGDIDGDGDVDWNDVWPVWIARNAPASGPDDPMDMDNNGVINILDARKVLLLCDLPRCVIQ